MATQLYHKIVSYEYHDKALTELMRKVWAGTPWVINVRDFDANSREWFDFIEWANVEIGPESCAWNNYQGCWAKASVIVNGLTDYGFSTEQKMRQFMARYPDRVRAE